MDELDKLITIKHFQSITGLSRSTILAMRKEKLIPSPVDLGAKRKLRWRLREVKNWLENLPSQE